MEEKNKFEITPIEEEKVKVTVEEISENANLSIQEVKEFNKPITEGVSNGNIKANNKEKSPTMGYVIGGGFVAFGIALLVLAFNL